ncbi:MAG: lipoyl(octanoyl) transferase LipB [Bacillota bacterium]
MIVQDVATMRYREAWTLQERLHAEVLAGGEEQLILVEHPPVITFGRRPNVAQHMLASPEQLAKLNVEVVQSDRGGDITFHGPGQIVAYPIVRLIDHRLSVGGYVRTLEQAVIATLADFNIEGLLDPSAIGIWVQHAGQLRKICALGVRIRRGASMHGIALNITTDLRYFNLIVPCGLANRPVTSMHEILGPGTPGMNVVKEALARRIAEAFSVG